MLARKPLRHFSVSRSSVFQDSAMGRRAQTPSSKCCWAHLPEDGQHRVEGGGFPRSLTTGLLFSSPLLSTLLSSPLFSSPTSRALWQRPWGWTGVLPVCLSLEDAEPSSHAESNSDVQIQEPPTFPPFAASFPLSSPSSGLGENAEHPKALC